MSKMAYGSTWSAHSPRRHNAALCGMMKVYQNAILPSRRDVACCVSAALMVYNTFNVRQFANPVVEGVSKMKTKGGEAVQCA